MQPRLRKALAALALLLVAGALLVTALLALPRTERGSQTLLNLAARSLPGLTVQAPSGTLLGDFSAARVSWRLNADQTLLLDNLRWQGLDLQREGGHWRLHIPTLTIERLAVQGRATHNAPTVLPANLVLPLAVRIDALRIGRIDADALGPQPVRALALALSLGAGSTATHRLDGVHAQWEQVQAQGHLQLQAAAPMALQAVLDLQPNQATAPAATQTDDTLAHAWQASITVQGPLARLALQAQLRARQQALDAQATVEVQTPQRLTALQLRAQRFDLAALSTQWPRTALSGEIEAQLSTGPAQARPVRLAATLRNERPGRWDSGALPLRSLSLAAHGDAQQTQRGQIDSLVLVLGTQAQGAGRLQAQGSWGPSDPGNATTGNALGLTLNTQVEALQPAQLDRRAPVMQLSGPLRLRWQQPTQFSLKGELQGTLAAPRATAVAVSLDAEGSPEALRLRSFEAVAGAARLSAQADAQHTPQGWALHGTAAMQAFDPSLWWPGSSPAWQRGPHRLEGQLQAQLQLLPTQPRNASLLARLRGSAALALTPRSQLAGVPLAGQLRFETQAATNQVSGQLTVSEGTQAGTLNLAGQIDPRDPQGTADRWTLRWQLPTLAPLAPWLRLLQASTSPPAALGGDLDGELQLRGRWPHLTSSGQVHSRALDWRLDNANAQALRDVNASWQAGSQPDDALNATARLASARSGNVRLDQATLQLSGSGRAHRLQVSSLVQPGSPAGTNGNVPRALRLQAQADGGWAWLAPAGWAWSGQLAQLDLREAHAGTPADATAGTPITPWLQVQPTALRWEQQGLRREFTATATRVLLGDATLALAPSRWQQDGDGTARFTLRGQLEPWAVAPLLARSQPGFGWRGDLRLRGQFALAASADNFQADLSLQRDSGDLQVQDPDAVLNAVSGTAVGPQALGLGELLLTLHADQGQWRLTQQVSGSRLGRLVGEQRLQTAAAATWPARDAALTGLVDLQVAQLGYWGRWLPPGWRLSGQLAGQARLTGQWGAPRLAGELRGQHIAVRNLLQGVDWHDADLRIALNGEQARIEQFQVLAGPGKLTASGTAQLGAAPQLLLDLQADHFAALQRIDRRVVLSGKAALAIDARSTRVTAQLKADEGHIDLGQADAPTLSDDVQVQRDSTLPPTQLEASHTTDNRAGGTARQTVLDVRADLGPAFELRGRGINTRLAGELRVSSPNNKLQLAGTVRAEDGTYAAYGQKLAIERGLIVFNGAPENPRLDILALRNDLDEMRVGVAITGTAQSPRVRLYSDPALGDTDKLSWLLLGRASDGLGGTDLAMLQRAAYALISGESDSPGLVQRLGLDTVSVGQRDGTVGDATVRQTVVSLGKQLSRRWYLGYERSLQATAGSWQLIYRLAQRFTLRAQTGITSSGVSENALDLIWTWKWGE